MRVKSVISFLAIMLTALALVPAGAHLLELPNKFPLSQEQYFTVQSIYRGWALFGFVLCGSIAANFALAVTQRRQAKAFWLALLGFVLTSTSLVIFLFWTHPTNQATTNWTAVPDNWRVLRRQWEYSHAAAAVSDFLGLCAVTVSILIGSD